MIKVGLVAPSSSALDVPSVLRAGCSLSHLDDADGSVGQDQEAADWIPMFAPLLQRNNFIERIVSERIG